MLGGVRDFTTANGYTGRKTADPDVYSINFNQNLESFMPTLPWTFPFVGFYLSLSFLLRMVDMAQEWGGRCNEGKLSSASRELVKGNY